MTAIAPETAKPNRFAIFAATLFLVGVVSIAAQFLAIAMFGLAGQVRLEGSYGPGLVAVISAFVMSAKALTWDTWRRWIWLPIVIAVTVAFIVTGFFAQSMSAQAEAEQERCDILWQQLEAKSDQIATLKDELAVLQAPSTVPAPSWASENSGLPAPSWSEEGKKVTELTNAQLEYSRLHDEHATTCREIPEPR